MKKLFSIAVFATILFNTGCKKDDGNPPADTAATIIFNSPAANSRYANGSTLQIRGSIDDADILKNAKVEVKNKATGAVLFTQTNLTGNLSVYSFNWSQSVSGITALFTATVKVTSTDQYDYQTSKEVDVIFEP